MLISWSDLTINNVTVQNILEKLAIKLLEIQQKLLLCFIFFSKESYILPRGHISINMDIHQLNPSPMGDLSILEYKQLYNQHWEIFKVISKKKKTWYYYCEMNRLDLGTMILSSKHYGLLQGGSILPRFHHRLLFWSPNSLFVPDRQSICLLHCLCLIHSQLLQLRLYKSNDLV